MPIRPVSDAYALFLTVSISKKKKHYISHILHSKTPCSLRKQLFPSSWPTLGANFLGLGDFVLQIESTASSYEISRYYTSILLYIAEMNMQDLIRKKSDRISRTVRKKISDPWNISLTTLHRSAARNKNSTPKNCPRPQTASHSFHILKMTTKKKVHEHPLLPKQKRSIFRLKFAFSSSNSTTHCTPQNKGASYIPTRAILARGKNSRSASRRPKSESFPAVTAARAEYCWARQLRAAARGARQAHCDYSADVPTCTYQPHDSSRVLCVRSCFFFPPRF